MSAIGKYIAYDLLPGLTLRRRMARESGSWVWLSHDPGLGRDRIRLERARAGVAVAVNLDLARGTGTTLRKLGSRPAGVIQMFRAAPQVRSCEVDLSDGDDAGDGVVGFCSPFPASVLVPDHDFFQTRGHDALRRLAAAGDRPWRDRSDTVLWRGSTTGRGRITPPGPDGIDGALRPRVRMCLLLKSIPGVDARVSAVAQSDQPEKDRAWLAEAGVLGDPLPVPAWLGHRFALDVDGNTNAWSNLFQRLLLGCCVLKVGSAQGFRQWYYGDLEPWRHYVPVRPDLSDLLDVIGWCRAHDPECEAIATAGRRLAVEMTFEREMARGTDAIRAMG